MNRKKIKIVSSLLALFITLMPLAQTQAESFSTSASGSTSISEGEEFVVTFSFSSSINIYGIDAALNYDSSKLSMTNYAGAGSFSATVGGRISAWTVSDTSGGSFASVTFKALSGFGKGDSTTISLGSVSGSDGNDDVSGSGCSITVSIPGGGSSGNNDNNGGNGSNSNMGNNGGASNNDPSLSSDSSLKSLSIEGYALSPSFGSSRYDYSVSVDFATESLNISALPNDDKASVRYEGNELKAGAETQVFIIVTAENGSTSTYTIKAKRGTDPNKKASDNCFLELLMPSSGKLSPVFNKNTFNYVVETDSSVKEMTFETKTEDANAVCNVIGEAQLISGRENMYHIICTAEDGVSSKIYTVTVRSSQSYETYISKSFINSVVKRINNVEKNIFLDMSFCPVQLVSADIFKALSANEGITLTVKTKNGTISFNSAETNYEITEDIYDLTMIRSSTYSNDFLSAMGSYENYVFSTHHKNELPGFATFNVYTNFGKGQIVNIYAYDASEDKMIIAAKNVVVGEGGVVAFEMDKGGDFVITTMDVEDAEAYHSVNRVNNTHGLTRTLGFVAVGLLALLIGFVGGYFAQKGKKSGTHQQNKNKKKTSEPKVVSNVPEKSDKPDNEEPVSGGEISVTKEENEPEPLTEPLTKETGEEKPIKENKNKKSEGEDNLSDFEAMLDKRLKKK